MGLRIIDRRPKKAPVEISEAELIASLAEESRLWAKLHGPVSADAQKQFLDKFRNARGRLTSPAEVTACAQRIREQLAQGYQRGGAAHAQVDIATLLELL